MGRWKPEESDAYVRTSRTVVIGVQLEVATKLRTAGFSDVVGENDLLKGLAEYCTVRNMDQYELETMLQRLRDARSFGLRLTAPEVDLEDAWPAQNLDKEMQVMQVMHDELARPEEPEMEGPAPVQLSMGVWVVSLTKGGTAKTLHKIGACWRKPGLHYQRFVTLDEEEVTGSAGLPCPYNKVCIECFPSGLPESESSSEDDSSESGSSSA